MHKPHKLLLAVHAYENYNTSLPIALLLSLSNKYKIDCMFNGTGTTVSPSPTKLMHSKNI
jgi:hypothetical protein